MKKSIKSLFYFVDECPGRGSEDIEKGCNVNGFDFFLLYCLFDGSYRWKNHNQRNSTTPKTVRKKHTDTGKDPEAH